jgi:hypothetical protein
MNAQSDPLPSERKAATLRLGGVRHGVERSGSQITSAGSASPTKYSSSAWV